MSCHGREQFVGLANFAELAQDEIFWRAVRNTLIWACTSPLFEVSIALLLSLALYAKVPGARFFRIAWFTPVLMSYVVVGIIWAWIYNYDWGAVNHALRALGLGVLDARLARQARHRAAGADLHHHLDVDRLQHGGAAGRAAFAAVGGDRGGRARQLRLVAQARLRDHPDDPRRRSSI